MAMAPSNDSERDVSPAPVVSDAAAAAGAETLPLHRIVDSGGGGAAAPLAAAAATDERPRMKSAFAAAGGGGSKRAPGRRRRRLRFAEEEEDFEGEEDSSSSLSLSAADIHADSSAAASCSASDDRGDCRQFREARAAPPRPLTVECRTTLGRWELTSSEIANAWYGEQEFLRIKMDVVSEASAVASDEAAALSGGGDGGSSSVLSGLGLGGGRRGRSLGGRSGSFRVGGEREKGRRRGSFGLGGGEGGRSTRRGSLGRKKLFKTSRGLSDESDNGDTSKPRPPPPRGLEMIHPATLLSQRQSRTAVVFAVLKEQAAQEAEGRTDPWAIGYASLRLSRPNVDEAVERGKSDESVAREILGLDDDGNDDGSLCSSSSTGGTASDEDAGGGGGGEAGGMGRQGGGEAAYFPWGRR